MKYTGEFYSINNVLYKIEITTKTSGSDKKLLLSGNPFVSSVAGDDDKHIYSPIRCGGATVGILTDSYVPDFYSGNPQDVSIKLINQTNSNKVEWTGYISPSIYSQGFDKNLEEIELDCVDGIAVLKNYPFEIKGDVINTFGNIIFNCLKKSGCYSAFYITDNVQFTQTGTESIIEKLRVSQSNFFSNKQDKNQTDDDVSFYYYDVLFELLQYLGYSLIVEGDEVFIIDYDAIKSGNNKYFKYSLSGSTLPTPTSTTMSYSKHIEDGSYAENGTNIEMTEIYNKVTVKDEFNTFDNLFPAFGDESTETNITAPQANLSSYFNGFGYGNGFIFGDHIAASKEDGIGQNMFVGIDEDWNGKVYLNFFKFYDSPVFNMIKYSRSSEGSKVDLGSTIKYSDLLSYNGAFYYRWYKAPFTQSFMDAINLMSWVNRQKSSYNYNASTKDKIKIWEQIFDKFKDFDKLKLTNVIAFLNAGNNRFGPGDGVNYNSQTENDVTKRYPFVTLKSYDSSIFGGKNHYLKIKGTFSFHDEWKTPHKLCNGADNKDLKRAPDYKRTNQGYIWCKLKWGNQYWTGTDWTTTDSWFKLWFWSEDDQDNGRGLKVENCYDKDFDFKSVEYTFANLGNDGVVIPCPNSENLSGQAELSFTTRDMWGDSRRSHWHPKGNKGDNFYCRYLSNCVFISNLQVTAEIYEGLLGDSEYDSDTVYTNVIENGAVNKMDEITFKVCTDDGKKPSYSSVDYVSNGSSKYVETLYNKALYNLERNSTGVDGKSGSFRQEEHYIFKIATQYENPMLVFNCNLKNEGCKLYGTFTDKTLSGRTFIPVEKQVDYKFNKCSLKLTEKF